MGNNNYTVTIKQLPEDERPRERLIKYGSNVLSNAELLAIILGSGTINESAITLSQRVLSMGDGLGYLSDAEPHELIEINGIGQAKSAQIKAAVELGKRIAITRKTENNFIRSPQDVVNLLMDEMRFLKKEYMKLILLNTKCGIISIEDISIGSLNSSIVHPRELFVPAIKKSSASIIMVHNHPSGDPAPSQEDINITRRIIEAGKIIGIELNDHIIIGDGRYVSLKERNII